MAKPNLAILVPRASSLFSWLSMLRISTIRAVPGCGRTVRPRPSRECLAAWSRQNAGVARIGDGCENVLDATERASTLLSIAAETAAGKNGAMTFASPEEVAELMRSVMSIAS
jgi:hypothetical protein